MGDEMKQTETGMPSLTLEPELVMEPEKEPEVQAPVQLMEVTQEMNPVQQKMAQTVLTPEEQQMVEDFAGKIDLENLTQVMQYGAGTQKKMADFSDEALKNVRSQCHLICLQPEAENIFAYFFLTDNSQIFFCLCTHLSPPALN